MIRHGKKSKNGQGRPGHFPAWTGTGQRCRLLEEGAVQTARGSQPHRKGLLPGCPLSETIRSHSGDAGHGPRLIHHRRFGKHRRSQPSPESQQSDPRGSLGKVGGPMLQIAIGLKTFSSNLKACWGFDSMYQPNYFQKGQDIEPMWLQVMVHCVQSNPDIQFLFNYSGDPDTTRHSVKLLRDLKAARRRHPAPYDRYRRPESHRRPRQGPQGLSHHHYESRRHGAQPMVQAVVREHFPDLTRCLPQPGGLSFSSSCQFSGPMTLSPMITTDFASG